MPAMQETRVQFLEGYVLAKDWIVIAARPVVLDDEEELTRFYTFDRGQWMHFDFDITVTSVCATAEKPKNIFLLGWNGRIVRIVRGQPAEERILGAGLDDEGLGYVMNMRNVAGELYVCGSGGQVYRRTARGWVHADDGVLDAKGATKVTELNCIDGTSSQDLYTVGDGGLIFHYQGRKWNRLSPPVNRDLHWLKSVSDDEVYVCGASGTFLRGSGADWEVIAVPDDAQDLWCVESLNDTVYLASDNGLLEFDGKKVGWVKTGMKKKVDGNRLHANDGVLWSVGTDHLCFFDGKNWTYVNHPDNP